MTILLDYAALSTFVYNDKRGEFNVLAPLPGWTELLYTSNPGFTAGAYRNGNDIVIAFKGSDAIALDANGLADWLAGNVPSFLGLGSAQLVDAALFYQAIKAANPGANITFTGHSLGGGIAAVLAVWFDKQATTFDQAPFALTALNPLFTGLLAAKLVLNGIFDSDFTGFAANPLAVGLRSSNVQDYFVDGEILAPLRTHLTAIYGSDIPIVIGGGDAVSPIDLHSMNLAAALLMQDKLRTDSVLLPNLLPAIFDEKLYANNLAGSRRDFLTSLLNDQITQGYTNPNGALAKFATDIEKLAQGGLVQNNDELNKALIVAGMEYYYFKDPASTTALFTAAGNGLHFKYSDIGASSYKSLPLLARAIEALLGPAQSFQTGIYGRLIKQDAWHIQSGSGGMTWIATGADNDAAIGGDQADVLDAGAGNDVLLGFGGSDTLTGGAGDDFLMGGAGSDTLNGGDGYDTYIIEGSDTIEDIDGKGFIKDSAGKILSGLIEKRQDGSYVFLADTTVSVVKNADLTLTFSNGNSVTIKNYADGQLGLNVADAIQDEPTAVVVIVTDASTVPEPTGVNQSIFVTGDKILNVTGGSGADRILDGGGRNRLIGNGGNDIIEGGGGADILSGDGGDDRLYAEVRAELADAIAAGATGAGGGAIDSWLSGGSGNDILVGSASNDVLQGGADEDVLIGGAGDDHIQGDGTGMPEKFEWQHNHAVEGDVEYHTYTNIFQGGVAAAGGADVVYAGSGDDNVWGEHGDDIVYGEAGNDYLEGGIGNDLLSGGEGDDVLWGDDGINPLLVSGNDVLIGDAGNDTAVGGLGDDVLQGGDGNDLLYGDIKGNSSAGGNDILEGGKGDDELVGGLGDDVLTGGLGADRLYGDAGNDSLTGDEGDDQLVGGAGNDALIGGAGLDSLFGEDGDDTLRGDENDDILMGGAGNDTLLGGAGVDELQGGDDNDQLEGGEGDDVLAGDAGDDALYGEAGNDELQGGMGNDVLSGEAGNDLLVGGDGDDILTGGLGSDELQGGLGADFLVGGEGADRLFGEAGNDALYGGADNDLLYGGDGDDVLDGGAGADELQGGIGNDTLSGGTGIDRLFGEDGDDVLDGGASDDELQGGAGNDILAGETGNDRLFGEDGDDILTGDDGNDVLVAGGGADFVVGGAGDDLLLGEGDNDALYGGEGNDSIEGGIGDDTLDGCEGDDQLFGQAGDDVLHGGQGNDLLVGGGGNDTLNGDAGNDQLQGRDGDDELNGGEGDDALYGNEGIDTLIGGTGDDFLTGGMGDDVLAGGDGNDVYIFNLGDGVDTITDSGANTLSFGGGISVYDISLGYGSLLIKVGNNGDAIHMENFNPDDVFAGAGIDRFTFADGTVLNYEQLLALGFDLNGTTGDDVIRGTNVNDRIIGFGGNDTFVGGAGDDELLGDNGQDLLLGGEGDDFLDGYSGNDLLDGGAGNDFVDGGDGNDIYLFGNGDGIDTLRNTGRSNEYMNDIIQMKEGVTPADVSVTVVDSNVELSLNGGLDRLNFSADDFQEVRFSDGTVWSMGIIGEKGRVVTQGDDNLFGFQSDDVIHGQGGDDIIYGNGGNDALYGDSGNDYLYARDGAAFLSGGDGTDVLVYSLGNGSSYAVFDGGKGDDLLRGGSEKNIFLFGLGSGRDTISEGSGHGTIIMGAGILPADVLVKSVLLKRDQQYGAFRFEIKGTVDSITLPLSQPRSTVQFENGVIWTSVEFSQLALQSASEGDDLLIGTVGNDVIHGLCGNDTLWGKAGNDLLRGGAGNDSLWGWEGDDTLDGGSGNDSLVGGAGSDLYRFGKGSGNDILGDGYYPGGNKNTGGDMETIELASGILPQDTMVTRGGYRGTDLIIAITGAPDTLTVGGWFDQDDNNTLKIKFADGTEWNAATINIKAPIAVSTSGIDYLNGDASNDVINGAAGNDIIRGNAGNDVIDGGAGNDDLSGGSGSDTFIFGYGSGADTLFDHTGVMTAEDNDVIQFAANVIPGNVTLSKNASNLIVKLNGSTDSLTLYSWFSEDHRVKQARFADGTVWNLTQSPGGVRSGTAWADTINGTYYDDVIYGLGGNDRLEANVGHDALYGGDGNDFLIARLGDDLLDGGAGNDTLYSEGSNNTYVFGRNYGQDIMSRGFGRNYEHDIMYSGSGVVRFNADVLPADIVLRQSQAMGADLEVSIAGSLDTLIIKNWFVEDVKFFGYVNIKQFQFADGTTWDRSQINSQIIAAVGTAGVDSLYDTSGDNVLEGFDGDDLIEANAGNDVLRGGAGNDNMNGGVGNDVLEGGVGNDDLTGGEGSDTYVFGRGFGRDIIRAWSWQNQDDKVVFTGDILPGDVVLSSDRDNLYLDIRDAGDRVAVVGWSANAPTSAIGSIEFSNGTVWDTAFLKSKLLFATSDDDRLYGSSGGDSIDGLDGKDDIYGFSGNDILRGGNGQDALYGDNGDDTLDGGSGNDQLRGDIGNDTYVFSAGFGHDVVMENDGTTGNLDTLHFAENFPQSNLQVLRESDNLLLKVGNADQVTVLNYFAGNAHKIERIAFADGAVLNAAEIMAMLDPALVNTAPTLDMPIADQAVIEYNVFSFTLPVNTFTDFNDINVGNAPIFSATLADGTALPAWLTFDAATRTFSGTPTSGDVGNMSLRVTATDSGTLSVSDIFNVTVNPATLIPDQTVTEDSAFSFTLHANTFADIDACDTLSLAATLVDGTALPTWLTFNATTHTFSGTPANGDVGSLNVKVTATDGGHVTVSDVFTVTVANSNLNDAPVVATLIADQRATEDATLSFTLPANTFTDIDVGDTLALSATLADGAELPAWLTFDAATHTFSGTPTNGDVGSLSINVTATDSGNAAVSDVFTVTVVNTNDAPVIQADSADTAEDGVLTAQGNVLANDSDVDQGTVLTVAYAGAYTSAYGSLAITSDGSYTYALDNTSSLVQGLRGGETVSDSFGYAASDGIISVAGKTEIRIAGRNDAPEATDDAAAVQEDVMPLVKGNVLANDRDIDHDTLLSVLNPGTYMGTYGTLALAVSGAYVYTLNNASGIVQSLAVGQRISDSFSYRVQDDDVSQPLNDGATLTVTIAGTNDAPVLVNPLPDQSIKRNQTFTYQVSADAFVDVDAGDNVTLGATLADGTTLPAWLTFNPVTRTFSGVASNSASGTLTIRVNALDQVGASASDIFTLTVTGGGVKGNEGVGNGEDPPPPGHDINYNDGPGTSPGQPGNKGGAGNNMYIVNGPGNVVTELANEGTDTVQSSITYTLGTNVENLTLTGTTAINGTGNTLDNVLTGNGAANTLTGGTGNDTYLFGRGAGQDIASNLDTTSTDDKVVFGTTIATDQLWFTKDANHLRVSIIGTADQITVQDWYSGSDYTVNKFQTANGSVLLESQVQQLVNAMASMTPPPAGQLTLTAEQQTALNPVLAVSWQSAA